VSLSDLLFNPWTSIVVAAFAVLYFVYLKYKTEVFFVLTVVCRFLLILFKWKKRIKKYELYCNTKSIFKGSYLIINYDFENVLWFEFKGICHKLNSGKLTIDLTNYHKKEILLIAHGFLYSREHVLEVLPEVSLNSTTFYVKIKDLNSISDKLKIKRFESLPFKISIKNFLIKTRQSKTSFKLQKIKTQYSSFNLKDNL
jgi:hypothetical protein